MVSFLPFSTLAFEGIRPDTSVVHEVIFPNVETFNDIEFTYAPGFAPVLLAPQRNHAVQALVVVLSEACLLVGICYDLRSGIAGRATNNPPFLAIVESSG